MRHVLLQLICILMFGAGMPMINVLANELPYRQFYLISNLADLSKKTDNYLEELYQRVKKEEGQVTILFLGDLTDHNGISKKSGGDELKALKAFQKLDHVNVYFTLGDRDWDNSGPKGYDKAEFLDDFIQKELDFKDQILPENACPGPEVIDIDHHTRLIFFNSQWFIHPYDKAGITDTDCKIYSEQIYPIRLATFWDELEELIEEAPDKNVIIAAHHPIYSYGRTGGHKLNNYHLIPVLGSFYKSFKQYVGTPRDLSYPAYQTYAENTKEILREFNSVIYVSGHDQSLDVQYRAGNIHINSGAIKNAGPLKQDSSLFAAQKSSVLKLSLFENGKVSAQQIFLNPGQSSEGKNFTIFSSGCEESQMGIKNQRLNPCKTDEHDERYIGETEKNIIGKTVANPQFKAGSFKKKIMGENYREIWTREIEVPYLDLDSTFGGLRVYGKGGSGQTPSLRFYGGDGNEYYFRSVRKNEEMGMNYIQLNSIYRVLTKDMSSTSHPYAGPVIASLLDATEILHEDPKLYLLPDSPKLGEYRENFKHRLGYLQQRVTESDKTGQTFGNAEEIHSTSKVYRKLFQNNQNRIDQKQYAKARMFDMWVGDWDRHEDNWKWAGKENKKGIVYQAIPKDRDRAFAIYDGLVPSIVDMVVPNQEEFAEEIRSVVALNFNARNLDRLFANQLEEQDWVEAADYIRKTMTDERIAQAVKTLPKEFGESFQLEISHKLKSRRSQLIETAKRYHNHIAEAVDIVGSNKREIVDIFRRPNGDVEVLMYDRSKKGERDELIYQRLFKYGQTKEIRIFTLGARDEINLRGECDDSILVRIIGGRSKDEIKDESLIRKSRIRTLVYDESQKDEIEAVEKISIRNPKSKVNYNPQGFMYDGLLPFAGIRNSSSNGFGIEAQFMKTIQGFNKPDWARKWGLKYIWYPGLGSHRVQFKHKWRHVIKETDLRIDTRIANLFDKYPYFFGFESNQEIDDELQDGNFYRTDYFTSQIKLGLEKGFWQHSKFYYGISWDYHNVKPYHSENSIFNLVRYENLDGLGREHQLWLRTVLDLDMRDRIFLPQHGSFLNLAQEFGHRINQDEKWMSVSRLNLKHHETLYLPMPVTLSLGAGAEISTGGLPFYSLPALGSNSYIRAATRNRYIGEKLLYFSGELRFTFGTWVTPLLPFYYGIYLFNDTGRVWSGQLESDTSTWQSGYGAGIFLVPVIGKLELGVFVANSPDDGIYSDFRLSLDF